jgi:hypothetical protein
MNQPLDQFDAESLDAEVVVGPDPVASDVKPAEGVMIPCPGDEQHPCDSAELLTEEQAEDHAGWVEEFLDAVAASERTAGQENNLGCALAWLDEWAAAKKAFARGKVAKKGTDDERALAKTNENVADRALSE